MCVCVCVSVNVRELINIESQKCLSGLSVKCLPGASERSYDLLASERINS